MDDLISRQAAIDAVEEWFFDTTDLRQPKEVLCCVPSAQPIIHCEACKWFQCNMRQDGYLPKGVDEFECRHWCGPCDPVDFCSRAERREE